MRLLCGRSFPAPSFELTLEEREESRVFAHELCVRVILLRVTVTSGLQPIQSKLLTVIQLRPPPLIRQHLTTTADKAPCLLSLIDRLECFIQSELY